ncbi:7758_t:CDS:2, partial [Racocetra persica]
NMGDVDDKEIPECIYRNIMVRHQIFIPPNLKKVIQNMSERIQKLENKIQDLINETQNKRLDENADEELRAIRVDDDLKITAENEKWFLRYWCSKNGCLIAQSDDDCPLKKCFDGDCGCKTDNDCPGVFSFCYPVLERDLGNCKLCKTDDDCAKADMLYGRFCVNGNCKVCTNHSHCNDRYICRNNGCVQCQKNFDCPSFLEGYCNTEQDIKAVLEIVVVQLAYIVIIIFAVKMQTAPVQRVLIVLKLDIVLMEH